MRRGAAVNGEGGRRTEGDEADRFERMCFGASEVEGADHFSEDDLGFEHGEHVAETDARAGSEWHVGVAVRVGRFVEETVGVEGVGFGEKVGAAVEIIHINDDDGAFWEGMFADSDRFGGGSAESSSHRIHPQGLFDDRLQIGHFGKPFK